MTQHDRPTAPDAGTTDSDGPATDRSPARRPWTPPALEVLPPLTDLTLQSGSPISGGGSTGGGGGTVF